MTEDEFATAEGTFGIRFPPDLKQFLSAALPLDHKFRIPAWPDWRGDHEGIRVRLAWPIDSICFDIEHNEFWYPEWGPQPATLPEKFEVARKALRAAPALVPVCSHRYIPTEPVEEGNPVWSMYQTDIILYGATLTDYFQHEFKVPAPSAPPAEPRRIRFWTDFIDYADTRWE